MGPDTRAALLTLLLVPAFGCGSSLAPPAPSLAASAQATAAAGAPPVSVASPTPAPAPRLANTIRWSTASEVDNFGFDVYRAESEEGPFLRLTASPVAGAQTSDEPHAYQFVDGTIAPGTVYFYYVESISLAGQRERFTPVIRAPAKGVTPPTGVP